MVMILDSLGKTIPVVSGFDNRLDSQKYQISSFKDFMELCVESNNSGEYDLLNKLLSTNFDFLDGVTQNGLGDIKFHLDSSNINSLFGNNKDLGIDELGNLQLKKRNSSFRRYSDIPDEIDGVRTYFSRDEVLNYANKPIRWPKCKENPLLLALARGNKDLLEEFFEGIVCDRSTSLELYSIYFSNNFLDTQKEVERVVSFYGVDMCCENSGGVFAGHMYNCNHFLGIPKNESKTPSNETETLNLQLEERILAYK